MQVIVNLLTNASKFSPDASEIDLDISQTDEAIKFRATDSGVGISSEDISKLFTPFPGILVDGNVGGTGLGLSICKGIVDLHCGEIWAESNGQGQGSRFYFTIPISSS